MAALKKKTRKELLKEPDEFLTWSSRLFGLFIRYQNKIFYAIIGLLAVATVFSGYVMYSNRQEARAASLLGAAVAKYNRLSVGQPKEKAFLEVSGDFERILSDYGSSSNGAVACLIFANLCYEVGHFKQATDLYEGCLASFSSYPLIHFQILKSLGYAYEMLQDYATAVSYFEQALSSTENSLKDDVLFHLGELYARIGNPEKSREAFTRLVSDHKDSVYATIVRERVNS